MEGLLSMGPTPSSFLLLLFLATKVFDQSSLVHPLSVTHKRRTDGWISSCLILDYRSRLCQVGEIGSHSFMLLRISTNSILYKKMFRIYLLEKIAAQMM